jgi:hypothetical protein
VVGVQGFEPWTPCSQSRCATRLRYTPTEPIFYTESAVQGKSCNILVMVAYFSSKFTKQIHVAFTAAVLVFCLLGTHWIGLSHSISHAGVQNQVAKASTNIEKSFNHSSDVCHLFDALSLAGFAPSSHAYVDLTLAGSLDLQNSSNPSLRSFVSSPYHSRGPPTLIL